jgi:hypothetical protein
MSLALMLLDFVSRFNFFGLCQIQCSWVSFRIQVSRQVLIFLDLVQTDEFYIRIQLS